jgi:hypothetical protein
MFDLRYHVASLAAVFLALIIGILVGVGISDRGLVDRTNNKLLRDRVASLQQRLDADAKRSADAGREQQAARAFVNEAYPVLVRNRLRNKQVAVVSIGSFGGGVRTSVEDALDDAGAHVVRVRELKVPIDVSQLANALAAQPAATGLRGRKKVEDLGRALGQELVVGGETPLWNSLTETLIEHRDGGTKIPADAVVVVRTADPQTGESALFVKGLYEGVAGAGVPAVGVAESTSAFDARTVFRQAQLSTVDDVDLSIGRVALAVLLSSPGAANAHYGLRDGETILPPVPPVTTATSATTSG